jgi:hypothetical protein
MKAARTSAASFFEPQGARLPRAHSLMDVSWLASCVGNGMPKKLGLVVFLERKIMLEVLNVTDTRIESPKDRGLPHVVGGVKVPLQLGVPVPSEVPLSLTVTVSLEPHPLVIVGDPLSTM